MTKGNLCTKCRLALSVALLVITISGPSFAAMDDCYLRDGASQRCLPPFVNAAYGKRVDASNTCGTPAEEYCLQTGVTGVSTSCHICDSADPSRRHDASFLTDYNDEKLMTWWQSSTMLHDVHYPNMVNLTLNLNKAFDITYVRLRFHTSRPESFVIYKKKCEDCDWQPFQYYSGSCFSTYGIDNKGIVTLENEQKALCTDEYSDISPLTGGNIAFSTLESRPSAYAFDESAVLQDWVKAVAIRITLNRINTFGDEVFQDPKVLKSYYYAISDLSVGARCSCNGHASECYLSATNVLQCRCEHNTAGPDCERCADMFNDRPWSRASRGNAAECQACDCNGMADSCYFDPELYRQTGHGGHCTECRDNTYGPQCAQCKPYYYRDSATNRCQSCECSATGSLNEQCSEDGLCTCKPGVGGPRCDQCMSGYYGLSEAGCRLCACSVEGTVDGSVCDASTGACVCKLNVEGKNCDRCKPGTMNMQESNPYGCTSCFCYGHSSVCDVAKDYTIAYILSEFNTYDDDWKGRNNYDALTPVTFTGSAISMRPDNFYMSYFTAPDKFLGQQRFSYNQMLEFELWTERLPEDILDVGSGEASDSRGSPLPSSEDLVLEGEGIRVVASIVDQGNPLPSNTRQLYRFRLHEAAGFSPRVTAFEFQKMINNLERIKIRSTYGEGLVGYLDNVQLTTAEKGGAGPPADWVEKCEAVPGHIGDFSDKCFPGFTRDPPNGGVYAPCVPCACNGHSDTCDADTGVCECQHNTMGDHCELCSDGFYFSGDESRRGTPQECQPCPCPDGSACAVTEDDNVVCTNCPPGHGGLQCEICVDGWFGDPRGLGPCQRCNCNGNIDENAVMNCDRNTGECLKCIHNTTGFSCEYCLPGYFGKPVTSNPADRCRLCECDSMGSTHLTACNAATGQCDCLPNVVGRTCDKCRSGFWNLLSGNGCEACNCHRVGASTGECDQNSGQCACLPGVGGQRCDQCLPNYYGLSREGCSVCECNLDGSSTLQCDENGQCICKEGVFGVKCDKCQENFFDLANGCTECPACYGLVQDAVNTHRKELERLEDMTTNIGEQPSVDTSGDTDFLNELTELNNTVWELYKWANDTRDQQDILNDQLEHVDYQLEELTVKLTDVVNKVEHCASTVARANDKNIESKNDVDTIRTSLLDAQAKLDQAMTDLTQAELIANDSLSKEDNMSRIAEEAKALANKHQASAQEIVDTAQHAYDTSKRAQDAIQEAINTLENLMTVLDNMMESDNKIKAARALRNELLKQSSEVRDDAEAAKRNATNIYTEVAKLKVPEFDTEEMDTRSQNIINDADALLPRITDLDNEYKNNYMSLEADVDRATELLHLAEASQRTTDILLTQAYSAFQGGMDAVERGNASYEAVLNTKRSLESFDEEINTNKDNAKEALANAGSIQAKIDEANQLTNDARNALGSASATAIQASNKAQQASDIAKDIKTEAGKILTDAIDGHQRANDLSKNVTLLQEDLDSTNDLLTDKEHIVRIDQTAIQTDTDVASDALAKANAAKQKVTSILAQLRDLLTRLERMTDIDDNEIAELELLYESYKGQVDDARIPETIKSLQDSVNKQELELQEYDRLIAELTAQIDNLRDISEAFPGDCSITRSVEQP